LRYRPADAMPSEARSTSSSAGRQRGGGEHKGERTVYVLNGNHPRSVQIKTGISDGVATEVIEGLKEGDRVITAETSSTSARSPAAPNPFGGGRRFP
jgi:hypothetical protein